MTQIPLDFVVSHDYSMDVYFVDPTVLPNPLDILLNPVVWGDNVLLICGERASGKTHLAHIYASYHCIPVWNGGDVQDVPTSDSAYCVIDNVDKVAEHTVFHILNACKQHHIKCLLTSTAPIQTMAFQTPDVISRLQQAMLYPLNNPTDAVLQHILLKTLNDYNLFLNTDVVSYIIPRLHRSYAFIQDFVITLNNESLTEKSNATIPFVKNILDNLHSPKLVY